MGGQVAFTGSHLMDPSGYELIQAHKGSRVQGGRVVVVSWPQERSRPLLEEGFPHPFLQGGIGGIH